MGPVQKKSIFERQKEEAEAKRARDQAETAAVYEDFVKSFDNEDDAPPTAQRGGYGTSGGAGHAPVPGKRHFTGSGLKSGPGSLGPTPGAPKSGPGSLGHASGYGKKRPFDDYAGRRDRDRNQGMFAYNEGRYSGSDSYTREEERRTDDKDSDELKAAAKPTLHLSSLPPGTSPAVVKALLVPSPLVVEDVRIIPASSLSDRNSMSAIVTLAAETPATDIDTMVSHLQNKYLGFGFNLSISRHLSSAALTGINALSSSASQSTSLPFGAKPILQQTSLSRAPPPGQTPGRFAPPTSYTSSVPYGSKPQSQVIVQPPSDLKQLKLIHKTIEALLTYGPEFEALLMSRPQIQRDEEWAWLWNSRSTGGVYYRWRLWEILTNSKSQRGRSGYGSRPSTDVLFEGQSHWIIPEAGLKFEYTTGLDEFISDEDYNSSDEEGDDEGGLAKRYNDHNASSGAENATNQDASDGMGYLNPLAKTKLVHLLSRLPETNAKLRRGDVARITGFAIEHAGSGAAEVTTLITRNVVQPFCHLRKDNDEEQENESNPNEPENQDTTPASLVGLYIISDILSSSANAGVRHAWRYRSLFETSLRQQKIFEKLGRIDEDLGWGKLKAEKWKRSVQSVLSLWEGWCVFPQAAQEEFVDKFLRPPLTEAQKSKAEAQEKEKAEEELKRSKSVSKWRSVDAENKASRAEEDVSMLDVDGTALQDEDEDGDGDGRSTGYDLDEDVDGVPMVDSSDEDEEAKPPPILDSAAQPDLPPKQETPSKTEVAVPMSMKRQRPKAVDMFADDSE